MPTYFKYEYNLFKVSLTFVFHDCFYDRHPSSRLSNKGSLSLRLYYVSSSFHLCKRQPVMPVVNYEFRVVIFYFTTHQETFNYVTNPVR